MRNLLGSSIAALGLMFSVNMANAYTLSTDVACDAAAAVFNPEYSSCVGAYVLDNGENDVTDGAADNIVNQLLNVDDVFGEPEWTFLAKQDTSAGNTYFTINGIDGTSGNIVFDVDAINTAFGPSFLDDYEIAISFKAANNFSIYQWDAPIGVNTIEWTTDGIELNIRDNPQALSHGSVYFRPGTPVPEPGSLALLGLGLAGLGLARRRKS